MITAFQTLAYIDPTGGLPPSAWAPIVASLVAGIAACWTMVKIWGSRAAGLIWRRDALIVGGLLLIAPLVIFFLVGFLDTFRSAPTPARRASLPRRVVILGLDGLDPLLLDRYMAEGRLPSFSRLAKDGLYRRLATTTPPQSPVAWSSFITGRSPGFGAHAGHAHDHSHGHGVFDFIKRDPKTYLPDLTIADRRTMALPWDGPPFWDSGAIARDGLTALRLPITFPPPKLQGKLLAGMGVWDVRGTEGTYFFFATKKTDIPDARGMILPLTRDGAILRGELPGPYRAGQADDIREPFELDAASPATLRLQGKAYELHDGRWSGWIAVEFRFGAMGLQKVRAVTRVLLRRDGSDASLYVSPLNFDPASPLYPISSPRPYAGELAGAIGMYHTRGMPFDTQALSDGVITDDDFLAQCKAITDESERMLFHELSRADRGVLFAYFETPDIIQHMFWRCIDPEHPLHGTPDAAAHRDVIPNHYAELDALVGRVRAAMGEQSTLVALSDHGFAPFRRAVHLNRVLAEAGYLKLKEGKATSGEFFEGVDWSKTRAYALGFNAVYLNLAGREGQGVVRSEDAASLAKEIAAKLEGLRDGEAKPIKRAIAPRGSYAEPADPDQPDVLVGYARGYRASWETALGAAPAETIVPNNKKWSGDHCIDADEVPGVFFSTDPNLTAESLQEVAGKVNAYLE